MSPIRVLVVAALLALGSVDAKKHKLRVSKWVNDKCDNHPSGGKQLELKKDKCHVLDGNSIKVQQHNKEKFSKWINSGEDCYVTVYDQYGCIGAGRNIDVPADFEKCTPVDNHASSLKFWCTNNHGWEHRAFNTTAVVPRTSYSIDGEGHAHPSEYSTTMTTSGVSLGAANMVARAESTANATIEERGKQYDIKGMWAKHPWTGSDICYKCWTTKHLHFGKVECRSGPRHPIDCGARPEHVPEIAYTTDTETTTAEFRFGTVTVPKPTTIISFVPTVVPTFVPTLVTTTVPTLVTTIVPAEREAATKPAPELEERKSWHTPVFVHNPYIPGMLMCADAEWENRGKAYKQEIRLQKFNDVKKCNNKNAVWLNFDKPRHTEITTSWATASTTLSA